MATEMTKGLPRCLAPLPRQVETVALRYAWVIIAINLVGTAFGFWYYPESNLSNHTQSH